MRAIEDEGGRAKGYLLNVVTPGSIEAIVEEVEASLGAIEVCPAHAHPLQPALPPCIPLLPRLQPLVLLDKRSSPPSTTHASAGGCLQPGRADR